MTTETLTPGPYEAKLPRTGYKPAVEYLIDALQGQGKAIAKHVDAHLTNERVLDLAGAIDRAVALAVRQALSDAADEIISMQLDVPLPPDCETPDAEAARG